MIDMNILLSSMNNPMINMANPTITQKEKEADSHLKELAESYLESDDYYESLATSLKSAKIWKIEHRKHIMKALDHKKNLSPILEKGVSLILERLPPMVSPEAWKKFQEEFSLLEETASKFSKIPEEGEIITNQQIMGISDPNLAAIYDLGRKLVEEKSFENALCIFQVLAFFNPFVGEYWIGQGISLFQLKQYEDAIGILSFAKILQPEKAAPFIYTALCHDQLNQPDQVKENLESADPILQQSPEEKALWGEIATLLKDRISKESPRLEG